VRKTLLYSNVRVECHTTIEESILLPDVVVGRHCKIRKAIIDRGCEVPDGTEIGVDLEQDKANGYRVTAKGVVLVTRGMLGQPEGFA
jgi:glucose-1-phosphate adenylyltransferase